MTILKTTIMKIIYPQTSFLWLCLSTIFLTISCREDKRLKQNMTMAEVEKVFGKPKSIKSQKGKLENGYEEPTVIIWYYDKYPIKTSDASFGEAGYINFVPQRFMISNNKISKEDSIAWEYGEQSNSYQVTSFIGSFPADTIDNKWIGSDLGLIPIKQLKDK